MDDTARPAAPATSKQAKAKNRPAHCIGEPFGCVPRSWQRRVKTLLQLRVLVVLASYADARTGKAFPTVETLVEDCRASTRSIQMALRFLEKAKLIRPVRRGGRGRGTEYELLP